MMTNKGIDYHLRALGMKDRKGWTIVSKDERLYQAPVTTARPDFVLFNKSESKLLVVEYKSREVGDGKPTEYEEIQAITNAFTVQYEFETKHGVHFSTRAAIVYGDGQIFDVDFDDDDVDQFDDSAFELAGAPGIQITATELAEFMCTTDYTGLPKSVRESARRSGSEAHRMVFELGPE